ncbi:exonuclease domain-containing protein [Thermogemmatispora sp.]|uniref:exonuclease domain-containing protein n=1 Tax=Thermogemmatispora sp. TaxID=1968838 RepID=UPI001D4B5128|nr:exonuclease domain-containing protein [Thermogemmatispora sp.]MBX5451194.1 hypothetical protein [Thermogemmatispora sp.]
MGRKPPIRVALDLETTGLHVEQDAILEVAAVKFQGTTILDRLETLVAPGRSIPYRVQRLTGITPRQLIGVPSFEAIARKLQQFVGSFPIVGHSIPFDVSFLRRQGLAYHNQLIDTFELASVLLPSLPSYSLGYVARFLGVPSSPERHRAMADTLLAMHVFLALYERLQTIDLAALEELAHLDAPPDWPLLAFFRQELRERQREQGLQRGSIWGSLGQHFAAQLGMDPRVLSFAVARAGPPLPVSPGASPAEHARSSLSSSSADPAASTRTPTSALFSPEVVSDFLILAEARRSECERKRLSGYEALRHFLYETLTHSGTALIETTLGSDDYVPLLLPVLEWLKDATTQGGGTARPEPRLLITCASAQTAYRIRDTLLPRLQEQLGTRFTVAYLAERDGYLCLHRWFGAAQVRLGSGPRSEEARAFAKFTLWVQETLTGERGELTLLPHEVSSWERICSGGEHLVASDERLGSIYERCAYRRKGYCFYQRAEERARTAQIVITTHAGLLDDLSSAQSLLSEIPYRLILDADLLEEEWSRRSGIELSQGRLLMLLQTLGMELQSGHYQGLLALAAPALREGGGTTVGGALNVAPSATITRAELDMRLLSWFQALRQACGATNHFFAALTHLLDEALHTPASNQGARHERGRSSTARNQNPNPRFAERLDQALRLQRSLLNLESWDEAAHAWHQLSQHLQTVIELSQEAERLLLTGSRGRARLEQGGLLTEALAAEFAISAQRLRVLKERGDQAFALAEGEMVYWLRVPPASLHPLPRGLDPAGSSAVSGEQAQEHAPALYGQPIQIAPMLRRLLLHPQRATILAGVALAVAGDFSFARGRLALEENCPAYSLEGDHCTQTLLYIPNDVPEPNMPQYQRRLDEAILQMAEALEGQILVLFTSHAALRSSYSFIKAALEARDILLLGHGIDGSPRQLWQIFAEQPRVMLFGAGGFWEGVEELPTLPSCLFITRLPMPALNDPPLAARAEQYADQLHQMTVPVAALRLRRTLNRLAWSSAKRNSVIIFDRRLISKEYGQLILHSLPRCSQRQDSVAQMADAVLDWLTSEGLGDRLAPGSGARLP